MARPEETDPAVATRRSKLMMLGLLAIFVGPIVIAWLYSAGHLEWGSWGRTNRGTLLTPPVDLREMDAVSPLFTRANLSPGEWLVLHLSPQSCSRQCLATLDRLSTIRSLLGYSGQRVKLLSLGADSGMQPSGAAHEGHVMSDVAVFAAITQSLYASTPELILPQIVLIDWRRQLVLRFEEDAPSIDIKKDLKKLLRASKIR